MKTLEECFIEAGSKFPFEVIMNYNSHRNYHLKFISRTHKSELREEDKRYVGGGPQWLWYHANSTEISGSPDRSAHWMFAEDKYYELFTFNADLQEILKDENTEKISVAGTLS